MSNVNKANSVKKLYIAFILTTGSFYSTSGLAAVEDGCELRGSGLLTETVSLGTINVQRDLPVGTIIATKNLGNGDISGNCTGSITRYRTLTYLGGELSSFGNYTYKTNIEGVGIQLLGDGNFQNPPTTWNWTQTDPSMSLQTRHHTYQLNLVKTGPITSGTLSVGQIATETFPARPNNSGIITTEIFNMGSGNIVNVLACSINNNAINVRLDDVLTTSLDYVGKTASSKVFNLGLNCQEGARVNAKLIGTKDPDTNTPGVLQLSNAGTAKVAKGIGIQISYNSKPMELGENIVLGTSTGGQATFPFTARYYQTKNPVTAGDANATATLELTYQ